MKETLSHYQTILSIVIAAIMGVLARWLSCSEKMTISQFIGRSILNGLSGLAAYTIILFYPDADNRAIVGVGLSIIALGPTSLEMLFQRLVKK